MAEFQSVCEELARLAGDILLAWQGRISIREKGPADLVTEADLAAQDAISQRIAEVFPDHGFLGEEQGTDIAQQAVQLNGQGYVWVVDPLDGTTNYAHGLPHYAVSVALVRQNSVRAAAVYNPATDECFTAAAGSGAWLNGRRIAASGVAALHDALVAASFPPVVARDSREVEQLLRVMEVAQSIRRTGSAALNLCYVAAGRFDAYWATKTNAWDVAAGWLLVEEAGGIVTGPDALAFDLTRPLPIAAATAELHNELASLLQSCS